MPGLPSNLPPAATHQARPFAIMTDDEITEYEGWRNSAETRKYVTLALLRNPRASSGDATALIRHAGHQEGWENGLKALLTLPTDNKKPEIDEIAQDLHPFRPDEMGIAFS
jgi:hypothetical protein